MPEVFWNRTDHAQSFYALWDKTFPTEISDLQFLCKRCFDTRIYLKHGMGPLRIFSALWDKNFSIEIIDMQLLCTKVSDTQFFWNTEGFPYEIFRDCETKNIKEKLLKSLFYLSFFRYPIFSKVRKCFPTKSFDTVRQKHWQKIVIHTPRLLSIKIFETRFVLKHTRVPLRYFLVLWDKNFDKKLWYTPLFSSLHRNFGYPKFFETKKVSPTKFFVTLRQRLWQKIVIYPLFSFP